MTPAQQAAQRAESLTLANQVRHQRAQFRASIQVPNPSTPDIRARAHQAVCQLLADPPDWANNLPTGLLLSWLPRKHGGIKHETVMRAWLHQAGIHNELTTVGRLTERQRLALADALQEAIR